MKHNLFLGLFGLILTFMLSSPALAYIGPGAGLSAIGSFIALVIAVIVALVAFVWFPMKRRKKKRLELEEDDD